MACQSQGRLMRWESEAAGRACSSLEDAGEVPGLASPSGHELHVSSCPRRQVLAAKASKVPPWPEQQDLGEWLQVGQGELAPQRLFGGEAAPSRASGSSHSPRSCRPSTPGPHRRCCRPPPTAYPQQVVEEHWSCWAASACPAV